MSGKKKTLKKFKVTAGDFGEFEVEAEGVVSAKQKVVATIYHSGIGLAELSASMVGWKVVKNK